MSDTNKKILLVCRKAPYGNSLSREAIDVALAASAYEQDITIAFIGDGVFQLLDKQDGEEIEQKNQAKMISAFSLYEIENIVIDKDAIEKLEALLKEASTTESAQPTPTDG